jgi:CDP-glucose 4,6-dehydratase
MTVNADFWTGKKVLITGHTGFKGSWLCVWLKLMGAVVKGYALCPSQQTNLFDCININDEIESEFNDIRDYPRLLASVKSFSPEIVFHMAAQPLVRYSYKDPLETFEVNVMGTVNILEVTRHCDSVKAVVNVTTDKCYENKEWVWGYREGDQLGGLDPYSNSKACAELVTQSFRDSFFYDKTIGIATVRAGNVIGGGDWSVDRLIPDVFRAFEDKLVLQVRNPHATRPWQHVLEPLSGYLMLAEKLYGDPKLFSGAWNFGPNDHGVRTVGWIVDKLSSLWEGSSWAVDDDFQHPHEAGLLKLDISKASDLLGWTPKWSLEETLSKIVEWQRLWCSGADMRKVCIGEIKNFTD